MMGESSALPRRRRWLVVPRSVETPKLKPTGTIRFTSTLKQAVIGVPGISQPSDPPPDAMSAVGVSVSQCQNVPLSKGETVGTVQVAGANIDPPTPEFGTLKEAIPEPGPVGGLELPEVSESLIMVYLKSVVPAAESLYTFSTTSHRDGPSAPV